jgi:arginine utilization protein RocB
VTDDLAARAKRLALLFTSWPSVTGSQGEAEFAYKLSEHVRLKWFTENLTYSVASGMQSCGISLIMKRGRTHRTIVLTGHYDTVSFDDYGAFKDLALEPEALTGALTNHLKHSGAHPSALADFQSGGFLAGRGLLDMKAGLAAGLAAFEAYDGDETLIFLAVCDEEERSAGARAAVTILKQFEDTHALNIELIINLDSISDQGDGSKGRVVTYGSIGKQLLTALVIGKPTHAGYPQDGVNAAYVLSELVSEIELSPELSEQTGDEVAAPPATLFAKDLKSSYNVTTPHKAYGYWNTMQHRRSGADVLAIAMEQAERALVRVEQKTGHHVALKRVADFQFPDSLALDPALSLPEQTLQALLEMTKDVTEPTVILGFGSIPYPAVLLQDALLRQKISAAVAPFGLGEVNYFAGISDVSFFGEASGDLSVVAANTPIWGKSFVMPEPGGYPTINIGPWGRDYHTWLERLHVPYAFEILPRVLLSVIDAVAKKS